MRGAVGGEEDSAVRPITRTVVFSGCSLLFVFCTVVGGVLLLRATLPADSGFEPDPVVVPTVEESGPSPEQPQDEAVGGQDQALEEVGEVYQETKSELRSAYDESKDALPPEVAEPLAGPQLGRECHRRDRRGACQRPGQRIAEAYACGYVAQRDDAINRERFILRGTGRRGTKSSAGPFDDDRRKLAGLVEIEAIADAGLCALRRQRATMRQRGAETETKDGACR